ncbi:hypothetical protein NKH52_02785 [Mesorhizobium sp. M1066]|uniref:Uncharacterized protein n=1 Tax=Mesorhizobium opportunistum TaxID=593909 RepID=A0ABV1YJ63_9HYPH
MEKQADMYLSTLKSYVEAIGGQLELVVRLPSRAALRIERLGDVVAPKAVSVRSVKRVAGGRNRTKAARVG